MKSKAQNTFQICLAYITWRRGSISGLWKVFQSTSKRSLSLQPDVTVVGEQEQRQPGSEREEDHIGLADKCYSFPARMILRDQLQSSSSPQMEIHAAV